MTFDLQTLMPDVYEPHGEVRFKGWLLVPLRVFAGFCFLASAFGKIAAGVLSRPEAFTERLSTLMHAEDASGFYTWLHNSIIAPNPYGIALAYVLIQIAIGGGLVAGLLTRFLSLIGMLIVVNLAILNDAPWHGDAAWALFFVLLTLLMTGAGRSYGVDHHLRQKLPGWLV